MNPWSPWASGPRPDLRGDYFSQDSLNYGPQRVHRSRAHQIALTAPAPYAGGIRPSLLDQLIPNTSSNYWNGPTAPNSPLYQDFNAPAQVHKVQISFKTKSIEAEVNWLHPPVPRSTPYTYTVSVEGAQNDQKLSFPQWRTYMRMRVTPGTWYKVDVTAVVNSTVIGFGSVEFKSVFDRDEMLKLHQKAVDFVGDHLTPFKYMYRHKPGPYWENIELNRGGMMEKYMKDLNGQPATPINDVVEGLFFSANHYNGTLPPTSPFGDVRLIIPASKLLNPGHNLYFADFYCNYTTHYITIVVCMKGSKTDRYCARSLLLLDPYDNCFLQVIDHRNGFLEHAINMNLWVEIFYTESIPVIEGFFETARGLGRSKPGGLPNNKQCVACNLYPAGLRNEATEEGNSKKRAREDDAFEDFRTKKKPLDQLTLDEEEENLNALEYNSTFHLAMEMERERVKESGAQLGEFEIVETICSLVDDVVIEIGSTIEIPDHGFVGLPYDVLKKSLAKSESQKEITESKEEETALEALSRHEKEHKLTTDDGQDALKLVMTRKVELDQKMSGIQKMLNTIESAVSALDKKIAAIK